MSTTFQRPPRRSSSRPSDPPKVEVPTGSAIFHEPLMRPLHEIRFMPTKARPSQDLHRSYRLRMEIGLVLALLVLNVLFRLPPTEQKLVEMLSVQQEAVMIEEVLQTQQKVQPPPPPRPPVPIEVPNDELLDEEFVDLDAEMSMDDAPVSLPPPPPPPAPPKEKVVVEEEPEIFVVVEEPPELIGGVEGIQARINYPDIAKKAGVQGTVYVEFVVSTTGDVLDPIVVKGIGAGCDEEALRAVSLAKFKPGKQRGRAVKVKYVIPVKFRLQAEKKKG